MTMGIVLVIAYLAITAGSCRFMLGIPAKTGQRVSRKDMVGMMRRDGPQIVMLALLWLPILAFLGLSVAARAIRSRMTSG